jgi:hypothetical protein
MAERRLDAFILYNETELEVAPLVDSLEDRGVSTYFWRRDHNAGEDAGEPWIEAEKVHLAAARTVVVFLGEQGWGPNQKQLTEIARQQKERMIPVLIGDAPQDALDAVGHFFREFRYVDLRKRDQAALDFLVRSIRRADPTDADDSPEFDAIIVAIRDENDATRANTVQQIMDSPELDRKGLAARLRREIQVKFSPSAETDMASAARDPKKMSAIRSWLLTCLISIDAEDPASHELILNHLHPHMEPDENVRFWVLGRLYACQAGYIDNAAQLAAGDEAPQVRALSGAIQWEREPSSSSSFRSRLLGTDTEAVWPVLRALRVVPIVELTRDLCALLERAEPSTSLAYDTVYALANPSTAAAAAPILAEKPGTAATVTRVLNEARLSDPNAAWNFTTLLAALPDEDVDRALGAAIAEPATAAIAFSVRRYLSLRRQAGETTGNAALAICQSDGIDVNNDSLDIREDVYTLAAVMLAKDVTPPLAIGLFGDWGTGKSFFMESMEAASKELAGKPGFCADVVSIRFNAWHYAETNLWASLVSHILEQLAAHVNPQLSPEKQQEELTKQLTSAKTVKAEAEREKERVEGLLKDRAKELQDARTKREKKEITLRDLRAPDLQKLIDENKELKDKLEKALHEMGIPAVLDSIADLTKVIAEAGTIRGRITSLVTSVLHGENRWVTIALLIAMLAIPAVAMAIDTTEARNFFVRMGSVVAEITAFVVGAKKILGDGLQKVRTNLNTIEEAKRKVDELLTAKRAKVTKEEEGIEKEIAELKATEKQAEARISAAAAQVVELEKRVQNSQQGLMHFLSERAGSDDYRKHLGLISTIRHDFNSLGTHLKAASAQQRKVDRIVLYIDDLDRCEEDKVIEVLQAVHLLLAYPLFVVVVGVDPRWLLHSLRKKYRVFRKRAQQEGKDTWQTTPQNYLEKIFQIPFSLRPMTDMGYRRLMGTLMLPQGGR